MFFLYCFILMALSRRLSWAVNFVGYFSLSARPLPVQADSGADFGMFLTCKLEKTLE